MSGHNQSPALSDDARVVFGCHWGAAAMTRTMTLSFNSPWRITPRAKAALDELVRSGIIEWQALNHYVASPITYKPKNVDAVERISSAWLSERGKDFKLIDSTMNENRPPRGWRWSAPSCT